MSNPVAPINSVIENLRRLIPDQKEQLMVCCSGGADSMALLFCAQKAGYKLLVAHCLHDMRPPEEAEKDRDLVKDYCKESNLSFHEIKVALRDTGKKQTEEEYRAARYATLERVATLYSVRFLLSGHHADDQLETILMKLCRGTGLRGFSGIAEILPAGPVNYVRPMLDITKQDTYDICKLNKIPYNEDATNTDTDYTRNAVRHNVIPSLRKIFPHCAEKSTDAARIFAQAQDLASRSCMDILKYEVYDRGSISIPTAALVLCNDITIYEWLRKSFGKITGGAFDAIVKENVDRVVLTIKNKGSKKFDWPCKVKITVNRNTVTLERKA